MTNPDTIINQPESRSRMRTRLLGPSFRRRRQQQFNAGKLGMWLFLLTEILLFGGLFCAYAVYRSIHPGDLPLRPPVPRQDPRRTEHLRAVVQQPDHGLGRALRSSPARGLILLPAADAGLRSGVLRRQVRRIQAEVGARPALGPAVSIRPRQRTPAPRHAGTDASSEVPPSAKRNPPPRRASSSASTSP